ncbi:MAG: HAD-IA family hydrolase [Brachymonas denitrificans]|jgi:phosphoglycolate phosphatase|uniref:HAD family hydrolase n=1 Tax=Brachymonas denitrificans TaxID=28220 RepID=UPI001BCBBA55|nr:HAD-IA family hydrolase [Brachymonas denitrificans]
MAHRFDLICFDWDGTLYDSTASITMALQQAVVDVGGERPTREQARYVIGLGLQDALAKVAPDVPPSQYRALSDRYRHHYLQHMTDITLFEGIEGVLADLRSRGHLLAVATGKSRRGLDDALSVVALSDMFDATRTADQTAGKPHPLMLYELMDELEVKPEHTLMIGDTSHDLELAHNAGCACVAVSYGAHSVAGLQQWSPLYMAHSVRDLGRWLQNEVHAPPRA